jgi:hypothetical protein
MFLSLLYLAPKFIFTVKFILLRNMLKYFFTAIALLFLAFPVQGQSGNYCISKRFSESPYFDSSEVKISRNTVYAVMPRWPGSGVDTLKLDIYQPDTSADPLEKRPVIVFFYGGAWLTGSKEDAGIKQKCFEWARRGFVVLAPNYKLGWNCSATDLLGVCLLCQNNYFDLNSAIYRGARDAKAAMRWTSANASSYKIDTAFMFVGGESAGSINALHATFWTQKFSKSIFNGNPYRQMGSIDSAGPYPGRSFTVKGVINNCGAVYYDTSLKLAVTPVIGFHDASDCVVPYQTNKLINCCAGSFATVKGSKIIHDELKAANIAELHTVTGSTPNHCTYPSLTLVKESSCFIKKILCGTLASASYNYPTTPAVSCDALFAARQILNPTVNLKLYPVPNKELLNVRFDRNFKGKVQITSLTGKHFMELNNVNCTELQLDTRILLDGTYVLHIVSESGQSASKLFSILN